MNKALREEFDLLRRDIPRLLRRQAVTISGVVVAAMAVGLLLQWWVLTA